MPLPDLPSAMRPPGGARIALPANQIAPLPHDRLGRAAGHPADIPWAGWCAVLRRTWREVRSDRVSLVAAGCAFWGTLALFPALSMAISLYGMMFDPVTVIPQLDVLREVVPPPVFAMLSQAIHALVSHPVHAMGRNALISGGVTLWSSALGTKSLLSALNLAYEETERRGFLRFQAFSLLITLAGIMAAVLGLSLLVFMPAALDFLGLAAHRRGLLTVGGTVLLVVFVLVGLSVLYRFGPCRRAARWVWVTPGSVVATAIWLIASVVFSWYVSHIASYGVMYGPLGAVAGILVWFWVSAYALLLGAELNSALELQKAHDTTTGKSGGPGCAVPMSPTMWRRIVNKWRCW